MLVLGLGCRLFACGFVCYGGVGCVCFDLCL